jgi:hypothetical protein
VLQPEIIFQQDGAPPHWNTIVRDALEKHYPGRWIGRGGPISWPSRSPDISPLDFFLWGYVKDIVYKMQTWQEIEYRLDILRATNGAHVQLY